MRVCGGMLWNFKGVYFGVNKCVYGFCFVLFVSFVLFARSVFCFCVCCVCVLHFVRWFCFVYVFCLLFLFRVFAGLCGLIWYVLTRHTFLV